MARPRASGAVHSHETSALLLRRVGYGESDLVVTLFTESLGRVSALARSARKSRRRFGGAIEPMHTLRVRLDERTGAELLALREAALETPRHHLVSDLDRMEAAGRALSWVRRGSPVRTPEPAVWSVLLTFLDRLDDSADARSPKLHLAEHGLRLLGAFGWGLAFESCVACGKPCEPGKAAMIDATRGGLVCRACGGARLIISGATRDRLARASAGAPKALEESDFDVALDLVEQALRSHAGFD